MTKELSREKIDLFETMPVGEAVLKLAIPTVFGCLVMILYNLVDTYFVGMLNDPIQTTAVTLVAPVILSKIQAEYPHLLKWGMNASKKYAKQEHLFDISLQM